jgi:hypothetical protein
VPLGRPALLPRASPVEKSAALALAELSFQSTLPAPLVSPPRVTVKVRLVLPLWPSWIVAWVAAMWNTASSFSMVPVAVAVLMLSPVVPAPRAIWTV